MIGLEFEREKSGVGIAIVTLIGFPVPVQATPFSRVQFPALSTV